MDEYWDEQVWGSAVSTGLAVCGDEVATSTKYARVIALLVAVEAWRRRLKTRPPRACVWRRRLPAAAACASRLC